MQLSKSHRNFTSLILTIFYSLYCTFYLRHLIFDLTNRPFQHQFQQIYGPCILEFVLLLNVTFLSNCTLNKFRDVTQPSRFYLRKNDTFTHIASSLCTYIKYIKTSSRRTLSRKESFFASYFFLFFLQQNKHEII